MKLVRSALAAALCVSLGMPALAESVVGGGLQPPAPGGGVSAAGLLGRGRTDVDVQGGPVQGQFLAGSVSTAAGSNGSLAGRGRSDVDVGVHNLGQFGNKPPTTPPGSITPPLPGGRHAPEPASLALMGLGAVGCAVAGGLRRRKSRLDVEAGP